MAQHDKLPGLMQPVEKLARAINAASDLARSATTQPSGSIYIPNEDGTGTLIGALTGVDETGTAVGRVDFVGDTTPPSAPTGLRWTSEQGDITGYWDGTLSEGVPSDFAYVELRVDGETELAGRLTVAGSTSATRLTVGSSYDCYAVAVDVQGNVSAESEHTTVLVVDKVQELKNSVDADVQDVKDKAAELEAELDTTNQKVTQVVSDLEGVETKVTNAVEKAEESLTVATDAKQTATEVKTTADKAYADAESALTQSSEAKQTASELSGKVTEAVETANSAKTSATTAVQTVDSFKQEVSSAYLTKDGAAEAYATKTEVEQTADSLTVSVKSAQATGDEALSLAKGGVSKVEVQYAQNQSTTTAPTSGWSTTAPTWKDGYYIWQKTVTTYKDGTTTESAATCISGAKGADGKDGVGYGSNRMRNTGAFTATTGGSWSSGSIRISTSGTLALVDVPADCPAKGITKCVQITATKTGSRTEGGFCQDNFTEIASGETWTMGVWVKGIKGNKVRVQAFWNSSSSTTTTTTTTGEWQFITNSGKAKNSNAHSIGYVYLNSAQAVGDTLLVAAPKVEKGSTATEWSPAYEDLNGADGKDGVGYRANLLLESDVANLGHSATSYPCAAYYLANGADTIEVGKTYTITVHLASNTGGRYMGLFFDGGTYQVGNKTTWINLVDGNDLTYSLTFTTQTNPATKTHIRVYVRDSRNTYGSQSINTVLDRIMLVEGDQPAEWSYAASELVGNGVSSITPQYYLSTSATECTGGSWSTTMPTWTSGTYIWTRSHVVYTDGTTADTTPVLDTSATQAGEANSKATTLETLVRTSGSGVEVARKVNGSYTSTKALLSDSSMTILDKSGTQLASYGTTAIIGKTTGGNIYIDSDSVDIRKGSTILGSFYADSSKTNVLSSNDLYFFAGTETAPKSVYFTAPPSSDGYESDMGLGFLADSSKIYGCASSAELALKDGISFPTGHKLTDNAGAHVAWSKTVWTGHSSGNISVSLSDYDMVEIFYKYGDKNPYGNPVYETNPHFGSVRVDTQGYYPQWAVLQGSFHATSAIMQYLVESIQITASGITHNGQGWFINANVNAGSLTAGKNGGTSIHITRIVGWWYE